MTVPDQCYKTKCISSLSCLANLQPLINTNTVCLSDFGWISFNTAVIPLYSKVHREVVLQNTTLVCFQDKDGMVKTHCCHGQQVMIHFKMVGWVFPP